MRAVVIGAGMGGLVAALELKRLGLDVLLVERADAPGGKIRTVGSSVGPIDVGPTVLTMRWVFDALFEAHGRKLDEHVKLIPAHVIARHAFPDGSMLDLFPDLDASRRAVEAFAGPREAEAYVRFAAHTESIFEEVLEPFLCGQRPTFWSIARRYGPTGLTRLARIDAMRSLWSALGQYFRDQRLRQLFARYATYSGASPFEASATLALIAHVERDGVCYVDGGMSALAHALADLFLQIGGELRYGAPVERLWVDGSRALGVVLEGGERCAADIVVSAVDVSALAEGLLGPEGTRVAAPLEPPDRSLSAVTFALETEVQGFPLLRHNVFFSRDYPGEFRQLRTERVVPDEPTVYVCAQDREDEPRPGSPRERVFVLVNAPAAELTPAAVERCTAATQAVLERAGLRLSTSLAVASRDTPMDYARRFPGTAGAIYGASPRSWRSPFQRAGARTPIEGLYLAGGSVHPGAGVPMAALSGRRAAEAFQQDREALVRSRRRQLAAAWGR